MCSLFAVVGVAQMGMQVAGAMYQNQAAKVAATQARQQGIYDAQRAAVEAEQIRYNNQRDMGSIRAAFGKRGVGFDSASMVDVVAEAAGNMDYAALMKEHEVQLSLYQGNTRAKLIKSQANAALVSSILGSTLNFASQGISNNWGLQGTKGQI